MSAGTKLFRWIFIFCASQNVLSRNQNRLEHTHTLNRAPTVGRILLTLGRVPVQRGNFTPNIFFLLIFPMLSVRSSKRVYEQSLVLGCALLSCSPNYHHSDSFSLYLCLFGTLTTLNIALDTTSRYFSLFIFSQNSLM